MRRHLLTARFVTGASHDPAVKPRRLRDGDALENGDIVLIRGGDLDPDILFADGTSRAGHSLPLCLIAASRPCGT
jgi:hypothetical protein